MADHVALWDGVTREDVGGEPLEPRHLPLRKRTIAPFVSRVDELDPDRGVVDIALPAPGCDAGMPGAGALGHERVELARFADDIMRAHLALGIAQPGEGLIRARHAGVVKDEHLDRATGRAAIVVGRWRFDHRVVRASRSGKR